MRRWFAGWLFLCVASGALAATTGPITPWEANGGKRTPTYVETMDFCRTLAATFPRQISFTSFGISPQGRDLPLLIADAGGRFDPFAARDDAGRVVVLIQACIHAGECCGKDAGLLLLRDLVSGGRLPQDITVLFIPIFNVDGHARFSPYGRINQNGPESMGWRATAQNLNLNRDYLKADAPEMRAWLRLWNDWLPDFLVDVHSTDGADYVYPLTYGLELAGNLDGILTKWASRYLDAVKLALKVDGYPLAPYLSFRDWHDPHSGLRTWVASPRFSQGYAAVQNRVGLLIEVHMLKPYPVRVRSAAAMLGRTLEYVESQHAELRKLNTAADARAAEMAGDAETLTLSWRDGERSEPLTFLGVAADTVVSPVTGGRSFVFHSDEPDTFTIPWYRYPEPDAVVRLPQAYLVPPQWEAVIERLRWHGVKTRRLSEATAIAVRSYRFDHPTWQQEPFEGHHPLEYQVHEVSETRTFPPGTVVVPMDQRSARVVAHLLEPEGPDSVVRWGYFDTIFSQVEYAEDYVIDRLAEEMVEASPALRDSLAARKQRDPVFAGDPDAIRAWFYEKTPYHDKQLDVYPVAMLDDGALLATLPLE